MTDSEMVEAFKWIKTHYSYRAKVIDTDELISYLTEKLVLASKNFKPELGEWTHYYRATIYREFLKYQHRVSIRPISNGLTDDGDFEHTSPQLHTDELVIMAEFLSKLTGLDALIMKAIHEGIPRQRLAEHLNVPPATFYRHYLKLRHHVRTLRGVD